MMGLVAMIADIIGLEFVHATNINIKMYFLKQKANKKNNNRDKTNGPVNSSYPDGELLIVAK